MPRLFINQLVNQLPGGKQMLVLVAITLMAALAWAAPHLYQMYLSYSPPAAISATETSAPLEDRVVTPPGWKLYEAKLANLRFTYPEGWGDPEEDLTVVPQGKQYILSFSKATGLFGGSRTAGYTALDYSVIEVIVSRVDRSRGRAIAYLGDQLRYVVTDYKALKKTAAGEVGLGRAPAPGISGFEVGDMVGIIDLANRDFVVLVIHAHRSINPQDFERFLQSIEIR